MEKVIIYDRKGVYPGYFKKNVDKKFSIVSFSNFNLLNGEELLKFKKAIVILYSEEDGKVLSLFSEFISHIVLGCHYKSRYKEESDQAKVFKVDFCKLKSNVLIKTQENLQRINLD